MSLVRRRGGRSEDTNGRETPGASDQSLSDVSASYDALVDLFGSTKCLLRRLNTEITAMKAMAKLLFLDHRISLNTRRDICVETLVEIETEAEQLSPADPSSNDNIARK